MNVEKVKQLLLRGENIDIEFKTSHFDINKDVFDSICGFLNRMGGHLLLGVSDKGKVEGVVEACIPAMINNLVTSANNPGKLYPPVYLSPVVVDYEGKKIVYCYVPESSQVHNTNGRIFDRNGDGDLDITRQWFPVTNLYMRKNTAHSEDQVFPYFELADCNPDIFKRIRGSFVHTEPDHPWLRMTDEELVRSAGMYKRDPITGKSGMTLAAALLFGKDETIFNILPHHKTDAILRVENLDRYDDRDDIRTNLIDSFDRLMAFIAKHLPDKFYLAGVQRVSLRYQLFREIVSNLLIHREFANRFPAKLIIERDQVRTENWSLPRGWGAIDPLNFVPYPKNPVIAKFFKEIGRADELGSGVRNVFRYTPVYTRGGMPELVEGDVFRAVVPLQSVESKTVTSKTKWVEVRDRVRCKFGEKFGEKFGVSSEKILQLIFKNERLTAEEISVKLDISKRAVEKQIAKLKDMEVLERVGPDKGGYWRIKAD